MSEEDEKVHPLVSNLLEQAFVPRVAGETFTYDRDEMMRLRTAPLSVTRPEILSTDFDGEDGKFSPFKWLEHRWEVEGIKNRPANKKLQDALRADCDESGLYPQRRGFSSGCRAPTEEKKEKETVAAKEEGWQKFASSKGTDFKLPFQKTTTVADKLVRGNTWKTVEGKERQNGSFSSTGKFIPARSYRVDDRGEKLPEWAEDPTTMDDMIELRGFDEPSKKKKVTKQESKNRAEKDSHSGSRPSSRAQNDVNNENLPTALPETDAELCAILGLADLPKSYAFGSPVPTTSGTGLSGSRLSKFFNKTTGNDLNPNNASSKDGQSASTDDIAANPALAKLFSQPSTGRASPQGPARMPHVPMRALRLEDLEKGISHHGNADVGRTVHSSKSMEDNKGNMLLDPFQQAQLIQRLNRIAMEQEEGRNSNSPPLQRSAAQPSAVPSSAPNYPVSGAMPPILPAHLLAAQAQQILVMHLQHTYPNGVPPLAPQLIERMRNDIFRNLIARQQQMQALMANSNLQQSTTAAAQQAKTVRPAMIPASVQRHMSKTTTSTTTTSDEKREKDREPEEENVIRQQAEAIKKAQMQQQYNALMNAMQNGLPMAALRQGVPPLNQQATPQQIQVAMAAHAQRVAFMKQQQQNQQAAMMKLMALQQQQLQNGDPERNVGPHPSSSNGSADMLQQVGPIQTPLEKLLTAAGVQPAQFTGSDTSARASGAPSLPPCVLPMSLEELERKLTTEKL